MHPIFTWNLFGQTYHVHAYALFTVLGILMGLITAVPLLKRAGLAVVSSVQLLMTMAPAFFVGARVLNVIVNPSAYGEGFKVYDFTLKGFSVYGGIFGAFIALLFWCKIKKQSPLKILDALVMPTALAFTMARLGCFYNGCCGGVATDSFWGILVPVSETQMTPLHKMLSVLGQRKPSIKVYPTQFFEMIGALLFAIPTLLLYWYKRIPEGGAFVLFMVGFSLVRLLVLPLRSLPYASWVTTVFYPVMYGGIILIGLLLFMVLWRRRTK